jgi:hypothetical protein
MRSELSGVISAGFITMQLPAASAGAIFQLVYIRGEVPGHHLADDADRLAQQVIEEARLDRHHRTLELVGHAAEVAEAQRGTRHVERARVAQRMAGVERLEARQLVGIGLDQVGEAQQDAATVARAHAAPGRERGLGGGHGLVDISLAGHRDIGDRGVVMRVDRGERLAALGIDELAADEQLVLDRLLEARSFLGALDVAGVAGAHGISHGFGGAAGRLV